MTRLVYLTFNDLPGGIFTSQVTEVCKHFSAEHGVHVTLICFISRRNFNANKEKIQRNYSDAIVLPMFPGTGNWRWNRFALRRKLKSLQTDVVVARGPFATLLAKSSSSARVCFDARGAYQAEYTEYDVSSGTFTGHEMGAIEEEALRTSDFRIAVSQALVEYWKSTYSFTTQKFVVVPCTLAENVSTDSEVHTTRDSTIRIVFAGGNGKWQNLESVSTLLIPFFQQHENVIMIFLTNSLPEKFELRDLFPNRVSTMWLQESEVHNLLATCDYGWIVRETTTTNRVASPVKFAEYLAAGLHVLISPHLGDFSEFVLEHKCGEVIADKNIPPLKKVSLVDKQRNVLLAEKYFKKKQFHTEYGRVLKCE